MFHSLGNPTGIHRRKPIHAIIEGSDVAWPVIAIATTCRQAPAQLENLTMTWLGPSSPLRLLAGKRRLNWRT